MVLFQKYFFAVIFSIITFMRGCEINEPDSVIPVYFKGPLVEVSQTTINVPEPSGLVYNAKTNTLFTVSDQNSTIYELSLSGNVIRSMKVSGSDLEGITFTKNFDSIYVVEESNYRVSCYSTTGTKYYSWSKITSPNSSHAYEGITINRDNNLVVLNEKEPVLAMVTDKLGKQLNSLQLNYSTDISDICYDSVENCYWMISDESKKIMKLHTDFSLIDSWNTNAAQGEGIAVFNNKIYVVSDIDSKLIVYRKPRSNKNLPW